MGRPSIQETYLKLIQSDYLYYCDYVHNHNRPKDDLKWIPSRFHKFICREVQKFVEGETEKAFEVLIISTPPQHGKSESVTATFPSWYLMRNPDKNVIQVSYGDDLSRRFGLQNLNKVKEFGQLFGVEVDPDRKAAVNFGVKGRSGGVKSAGYGAGITGNPADLIIIDDPVKNMVEADSDRDRDKKWFDFEASIKSRLSAHGKIILIMTRWHEDDLAGRLIEKYPEFVTVLNLPCEAEEDDLLGRKKGEALCPEIGKDDAWLKSFKASHVGDEGLRSWEALYQGHPTIMEGNLLKKSWWEYYDVEDYFKGSMKFDQLVASLDATFKDGDKNNYVALEIWGKLENRFYLVDLINEHLNFSDTVRKLRLMIAKYPRLGAIYVEDKANGPAIINTLKNEVAGLIPVSPDASKESRVNAIQFLVEAGNVYLPRDREFTHKFVEQCAKFPNDKHDDMVDAMSQALNKLHYSRRGGFRRKVKETTGWSLPFEKPKKRVDIGRTVNVI